MMVWDLSGGDVTDQNNYVIHTTGMTALIFLLLSLCVTPLRKITGKNYWSLFRRMLGLYAFFYACIHVDLLFHYQVRPRFQSIIFDDIFEHRDCPFSSA